MWRIPTVLQPWHGLTGLRLKVTTWFRLLTSRERVMVSVAAIVLLCAGLYVAVWKPLSHARTVAFDAIARYETLSARLRSIEPQAIDIGTRQIAPATAITTSAGQLGLVIRRLEPEGNRVRVALEDAEFDTVIAWLDSLESEHSLRVVSLEMDRRPAPGVVQSRVMLED